MSSPSSISDKPVVVNQPCEDRLVTLNMLTRRATIVTGSTYHWRVLFNFVCTSHCLHNACRELSSPSSMTTKTIIQRIVLNQPAYEQRQSKKVISENAYYSGTKEYVHERWEIGVSWGALLTVHGITRMRWSDHPGNNACVLSFHDQWVPKIWTASTSGSMSVPHVDEALAGRMFRLPVPLEPVVLRRSSRQLRIATIWGCKCTLICQTGWSPRSRLVTKNRGCQCTFQVDEQVPISWPVSSWSKILEINIWLIEAHLYKVTKLPGIQLR